MAENMNNEETIVYSTAIELIEIRGLDTFIEYLQEVHETGKVPSTCSLDKETYIQVLCKAVNDYRKKLLE
jgi:ERCC4-related helicase